MNFRQKLFRNVSQINGEPYLNRGTKQIRIRSVKQQNDQKKIQKIAPYITQIHSPIKNRSCNNNKENISKPLDLIINSCDSQSLNLSYSPSSMKKPRRNVVEQSKKTLRPKVVSKKVQQIINIYTDKPKLKINNLILNKQCIR